MAPEQTSQTRESSELFYEQIAAEEATANSNNIRNSSGSQVGRTDRALESVSEVVATGGNKASIAFQMSFTIKLTNRTPFDPNKNCC
jgi:hypothetical protein